MPRRRKNKNKNKNPVCPPPTPKESCKYCHKSNLKLSKCSRCKEVFYCSVDCQKKDWTNHKNVCEPKTSEQQQLPDPPLPDKEESCNHCGKSSDVKLRTCSQCHDVKYCSKKCQKAEWPKHKLDCQKKLKVPDSVYLIAKMRHPKFQMVTNFDDIESFYYYGENVLLLIALMHKTAFHPFRPCMFIRDDTGDELFLIFYLDWDEQETFPWAKFQPGDYICVMYPYIHHFLDGSVGFRIESLNNVSFIKSI